ncbi:LysR family transcriptional regulator [Novosphingobium sp. ERN07]|uniref:LysR substrate-binding domain-containing protein n=1 Tax=Novosphingobium sp. ERN07 TaxID=2726187 RepID=UPI0014563A6A|nr:LysR substrate-binding domain-containing protein [Novosphingobium sp. ERN07]NLR71173.1 LysR family transcriptional regulator [Novosphingobium sp. ERN07]
MFELSQLRCFVAAAEELHFGRAAKRLNMTQSPLSRQIQLLERILDVTLLERTSRNVALTPAGRVFLIEAQRIVRLAENAALAARRVARGDAGKVSIGFTAVSGYSLVPGIVAQARTALPNIDLELHEMVSRDQTEALLTGLVDIAFMRPPIVRSEFETALALSEPLVVALPDGDPREDKEELTLADLHDVPLVMYSRKGAGYFHDMLMRFFDEAALSPVVVQHVTQIHSMLGLVRAGVAAAIVPRSAVDLHPDAVRFRRLVTTPEAPVELFMAWKRGNPNPALDAVRRLCLDCLAQQA